MWENYNPQELATPEAFLADPELVWRWYSWRRKLVEKAMPNDGHFALAELASCVKEFTLVTQNVDGLHQRAGSSDVIEYHGNLFRNRCFAGDCDIAAADLITSSPCCPVCGEKIRPDVVWFGEPIPIAALQQADSAASDCDVFLSVGTSSLVWPAAGLADCAALNGATVAEINPDPTALSDRCDYSIAGRSVDVLPMLVSQLQA